ncbi:MAG TPA: SURF1 family protein [Gemmatimonadaceae bacterium]|nr:SURF1 family protein [Gemmatimonadaceae bacterium]
MRRNVIAVLLALVVAGFCFRLGFWQLDRLEQRRALNARVESRMRFAPVDLGSLPTDSTRRYRQTRVSGTFDYDNELVLVGRSREGSPGVNIITPMVRRGERAVLVNRGWVYSPDARTVPLERWREGTGAQRDTTITGYIEVFSAASGAVRSHTDPRAWRRLDADTLRATLPYEVEPLVVVALGQGTQSSTTPARLSLPRLSEGSHQSYAVQWFAFGVIALVGVATLLRQDMRQGPPHPNTQSPSTPPAA